MSGAEAVGGVFVNIAPLDGCGGLVDDVDDGLGHDDGGEEVLDFLVEGHDAVVVVHGLGDAISVGGEVIGEFTQEALLGEPFLDGLVEVQVPT